MTTMGHISYPTLAYIAANSYLGLEYTSTQMFLVAGAAILPDMDFFYQTLVRKKGFDDSYTHHMWASHWPITYMPLFLLAIFTGSSLLALISYGVLSHLILDSFFCATGIMWFYPFSKKDINLFSKHTFGHHGKMWIKKYKELPIYKLDLVAFSVFLSVIIFKFIF